MVTAYRFVFVPYERFEIDGWIYRVPRHFGGARGLIPAEPELDGVRWSGLDFGFVDFGLVAADLTDEQFAWLNAQPGVVGMPEGPDVVGMPEGPDVVGVPEIPDAIGTRENLDAKLATGEINKLRPRLESANVPADWLRTSMTRRAALRTVCGVVVYVQRAAAIRDIAAVDASKSLFAGGVNLDTPVSRVDAGWRAALAQAANETGYDYSWVTARTTLRELFKRMGKFWSERPFRLGDAEL